MAGWGRHSVNSCFRLLTHSGIGCDTSTQVADTVLPATASRASPLQNNSSVRPHGRPPTADHRHWTRDRCGCAAVRLCCGTLPSCAAAAAAVGARPRCRPRPQTADRGPATAAAAPRCGCALANCYHMLWLRLQLRLRPHWRPPTDRGPCRPSTSLTAPSAAAVAAAAAASAPAARSVIIDANSIPALGHTPLTRCACHTPAYHAVALPLLPLAEDGCAAMILFNSGWASLHSPPQKACLAGLLAPRSLATLSPRPRS